ncbi:hypothetical protein BCR33DRAFT_727262 [Rhizoclosmatium globosum]|uniref:Uncharacterized protein n=1 Tax=Rhizoclosmatium globosum TaxID=329046 RepID=A0A1Y2AQI8_9FUNG|nr:hypothetical protein BCR33DRAFT_727262 [Rhizoclosmatium globosum]|eukprot:ORY24849.1 hypothetical protein BCR33DRAFT_727262 [Rhizoclosmatium globosum]
MQPTFSPPSVRQSTADSNIMTPSTISNHGTTSSSYQTSKSSAHVYSSPSIVIPSSTLNMKPNVLVSNSITSVISPLLLGYLIFCL